jgi:hypothetical protein
MVLSNLKWMQAFANTAMEFLEGGISNHSLALVSVGKYKSFGPKCNAPPFTKRRK